MLTDAELSALWRTEQVLHALARCLRDGQILEDELGYSYQAVCECAVVSQQVAAKAQRERYGDGDEPA